jgi:hypothetical protein
LDVYQKGVDILRETAKKKDIPLDSSLDYSVLCNNIATLLAEKGERREAEEVFEEAIAYIPEGADYKAPMMGLERLRDRKET